MRDGRQTCRLIIYHVSAAAERCMLFNRTLCYTLKFSSAIYKRQYLAVEKSAYLQLHRACIDNFATIQI